MRYLNWQKDPNLLLVINTLATASIMGFLYCLLALLLDFSGITKLSLFFYLGWFATSMLSLHLMRAGDKWGAYALAAATLLIGVYEIANRTATFGGAVLAAFVLTLVLYYLLNPFDKDENKRISKPS
jgi:hypothetical protein